MEIDWNVVLGDALTSLLKIFVPIGIALILHWAGEFYTKLKATYPDIAEAIAIAGQIGYSAAEEFFHDKESATGNDKLNYAIRRAESYLQTLGVPVDLDVIKDAIINYGVNTNKFHWQWQEFDVEEAEDECGSKDDLNSD